MSWHTPDGASMASPRKDTATSQEDRRLTATIVAALKKQDWSNRKIARRFGTSHSQIKRLLDEMPEEARRLCG